MYILNKNNNRVSQLKRTTFSEQGLQERKHLQEWIANEPNALGEELLIIQKEFNGFGETNERLDLLALDKQGNLVIIENKLDDSGRDVVWQALKYASYCASLTNSQIVKIFQDYINKYKPEFAQSLDENTDKSSHASVYVSDFLEDINIDEIVLNKRNSQRIILVAAEFRKEVTSTVLWLLSMRYQYGWENSDKQYVLLIHNDIEVTGDVVGELLKHIKSATAIGELGQCWWCPAAQQGYCVNHNYLEFKPKYHQLMYIYNKDMDYVKRRAYNLGLRQEFWEHPWPLPECRVNEWCMLVNLDKAGPATLPYGPAAPLGCTFASGAKIGEDWEHVVNLDTGVQWFRDLNHLGHVFTHYPIEKYVIHDRRGNTVLSSAQKYITNEMQAKIKIKEMYPDFFNE